MRRGATLLDARRVIAATWTAGSYFETLGIPLKRGRFFTDADGRDRRARRHHQRDARARAVARIGSDRPSNQMGRSTSAGTLDDGRRRRRRREPERARHRADRADLRADFPTARRAPDPSTSTALSTSSRAPIGIRRRCSPRSRRVQRLDPALPLSDAQPVADVVVESVKPQRFSMTVVGAVRHRRARAWPASGSTACWRTPSDSRRTRSACVWRSGARASAVMWSVLRRALLLMAIGGAIGSAGALALTRVMAGLLYEVRPTDAVTFAGSAAILAVLASSRASFPHGARRASIRSPRCGRCNEARVCNLVQHRIIRLSYRPPCSNLSRASDSA